MFLVVGQALRREGGKCRGQQWNGCRNWIRAFGSGELDAPCASPGPWVARSGLDPRVRRWDPCSPVRRDVLVRRMVRVALARVFRDEKVAPPQLLHARLINVSEQLRLNALVREGSQSSDASPGARSEVTMQGMPRMGGMMGMGGAPQAATGDSPQVDTAENVQISSLALLKMLKHGKRPDDRKRRHP